MVVNKDKQEDRMRTYFIESAMKIIRGEGTGAISVRTISEDAGYSFATLYNYFKDLKELMLACLDKFYDEAAEAIKKETPADATGNARIKAVTKAYLRHFIQYPGIFDLMFIEKMPEISRSAEAAKKTRSMLTDIIGGEWTSAGHDSEKAEAYADMINCMLLFYLNRRIPDDYKAFMADYEKKAKDVFGIV